MGHRAAIYRVQVRPHRDVTAWRLLGDYDEGGQWLGDSIEAALSSFSRETADKAVRADVEAPLPNLEADQVGFSFLSGRKGVTSVLSLPGSPKYSRTPKHSEDMRTAVLFHLPRAKKVGWMAVHVPENRSIKTLVHQSLRERFSADGLALELNPLVPDNALRAAVERDAIESVSLIKHMPGKSDDFQEAAQWGDDEVGRLVLFMGSRRNMKLRKDPLKKFLDDPSPANKKALYEFRGLPFDEVGVEVDMPDGSRRTFFVEARPGGHPMTVATNVDVTDELGATPDVLSRELRTSLKSVVGG